MSDKKQPSLIAYTVTGEGEKAYWNRIGAAWSNSGDGFNIQLSSLPLDGKIILMPPKAIAENTND